MRVKENNSRYLGHPLVILMNDRKQTLALIGCPVCFPLQFPHPRGAASLLSFEEQTAEHEIKGAQGPCAPRQPPTELPGTQGLPNLPPRNLTDFLSLPRDLACGDPASLCCWTTRKKDLISCPGHSPCHRSSWSEGWRHLTLRCSAPALGSTHPPARAAGPVGSRCSGWRCAGSPPWAGAGLGWWRCNA